MSYIKTVSKNVSGLLSKHFKLKIKSYRNKSSSNF